MGNYNAILDQKVTQDASAEPVNLNVVKEYMKVDYQEEDLLISSLIKTARKLLESKYDVGIIEKTLRVVLNNSCGGRDLPGSPITEIVSVATRAGAITDFEIIGEFHRFVEKPVCDYLVITYKSGYSMDQVPEAFKTAIKAQALWMFERRGDQDISSKVCPAAAAIMAPYKRNSLGFFL